MKAEAICSSVLAFLATVFLIVSLVLITIPNIRWRGAKRTRCEVHEAKFHFGEHGKETVELWLVEVDNGKHLFNKTRVKLSLNTNVYADTLRRKLGTHEDGEPVESCRTFEECLNYVAPCLVLPSYVAEQLGGRHLRSNQ